MKGTGRSRPIVADARGFINLSGDISEMASEMENVQALYKKEAGLRIRGEIARIDKTEIDGDNSNRIAEIAHQFAGYYIGKGFQTAYGIYDEGSHYAIWYAINSVSYADGAKYKRNDHDIREEEQNCLNTIIADVTEKEIPKEQRFDFDTLEYHI